jgi:hypothetical protein
VVEHGQDLMLYFSNQRKQLQTPIFQGVLARFLISHLQSPSALAALSGLLGV